MGYPKLVRVRIPAIFTESGRQCLKITAHGAHWSWQLLRYLTSG